MKRRRYFLVLPLLVAPLAGCGGGDSKKDVAYDTSDKDYYANIEKRNAFDKQSEYNFDDEITNGLSDDVWYTLDGYLENGGTTPHNGVRRRNLFYTKDADGNGYLAMKARGIYNTSDPSILVKPEGACIESKNKLGPGRFEVEMAAMPREGGVSAYWTYNCESSEEVSQNEIDIEIGGGGQYTNLWCTSWTTKNNKATHDPDVKDICYMNDGKMHKYTFDWYTSYGKTGEGRVDWFIDEQYVQSISGGTVTDIAMPIWLGIWLPSWAGNAAWEEDYMIIDRLSYTAFDYNQYYEESRTNPQYSPKIPTESNIQQVNFEQITTKLNKFANASFEETSLFRENDYHGWKAYPGWNGTHEFVSDASVGNKAIKLTPGETASKKDAYYYQDITCTYEGYQFSLSFDAKKASEEDNVELLIFYQDFANSDPVSQEAIKVTSTTYQNYTKTFAIPANSSNLRILMHVKAGTGYFDNMVLNKIN